MQARNRVSRGPDRSQLKPIESVWFPRHLEVRTDKPGGLVLYSDGLVGFENTNVIIRARSGPGGTGIDEDEEPHVGPLSLVFTSGGQETYEVDGRRCAIDDGSYLIHNVGQMIGRTGGDHVATDSYTIGFWPG